MEKKILFSADMARELSAVKENELYEEELKIIADQILKVATTEGKYFAQFKGVPMSKVVLELRNQGYTITHSGKVTTVKWSK